MTDEKIKAHDKSNDRKYFIVTPRLVWALCEDPYEYTFWSIVKDIAGEEGECILARDDMAILAMMSAGKASQCRDRLIAKKLLVGELKRDPGYPQSVWHLTIPDFWEANIRWARTYISLKDRIAYKRDQRSLKEPSPHDDSQEPSPDDRGLPPGDERVSPGDVKKNVLKNQKEEEWNLSAILAWDQVKEFIKDQMQIGFYEEYMVPTKGSRFDGNTLLVIAPSAFVCDWLTSRTRASAQNLLVGILKQSVDVAFVTE
jgi:hypothetical protein